MTREEHVAWCRQRALEYLNRGDVKNAVASMMSDINKHPDCGVPDMIHMFGMMAVNKNSVYDARRYIEGFN